MRITAFSLCLILFAVSAAADEVHLKDGSVLSGKVTEEKARYLVVDRDRKYAVKKSQVKKIVAGESFMDVYERKLEKLSVDDAEAIFEFGRWLAKNNWKTRASRAYEEVLELDPDHKGARLALGYKLYEGEWVSPRELNIKRGLVEFEGRWYTKHDHAELLAAIKMRYIPTKGKAHTDRNTNFAPDSRPTRGNLSNSNIKAPNSRAIS